MARRPFRIISCSSPASSTPKKWTVMERLAPGGDTIEQAEEVQELDASLRKRLIHRLLELEVPRRCTARLETERRDKTSPVARAFFQMGKSRFNRQRECWSPVRLWGQLSHRR